MKRLYLFLLCFFMSMGLSAQEIWNCGAREITEQERFEFNLQLNEINAKRQKVDFEEMTYVPLKPHVVRRNDGSGGLPLADINSMVAWLNKYYRGSNLEFYLTGEPNYIDSDQYYNYSAGQEGALAAGNDVTNAANVYFVNSIDGGGDCYGTMGYAYFPQDNIRTTRIVMRNCGVAVGTTMIHEVGHFLALPHTFDQTGHGSNGQHYPNSPFAELVNGSNCATAGDKICDTPADPGANFSVPNWNRNTCAYTGNARDANGQVYTPDIRNIMSYYSGCQDRFTEQQYRKMEDALVVRKNHRSYDFSDPFDDVNIPENTASVSLDGKKVAIKWDDVANNETGYLIERSEVSATEGFRAIDWGGVGPDVEQFVDNSVTAGKTYYYRVKSSNGHGAKYTDVTEVTVDPTLCLPYFNNGCGAGSINSITVERSDGSGEPVLENLESGCDSYSRNQWTKYNYQSFVKKVDPVFLGIGLNYDITLEKSSVLNYTSIWIDHNQDGVYSDDEKVLDNAVGNTSTFTVVSPRGLEGHSTMRVISSSSQIAGPCGNYDKGEAEDYPVIILNDGLPCAISSIKAVEGSQTACEEETNQYNQKVIVEYADQPSAGKLVVQGQEFEITGSPQEVELIGLPADGQMVNVEAYFSIKPLCKNEVEGVFRSPERCAACIITNISAEGGEQTACDPITNFYTQEVIVEYTDEPASGKLVVNGQEFEITGSPQKVMLTELDATGEVVDVSAYFTEKEGCFLEAEELFTSPEECLACRIPEVTFVSQTDCEPETNTFDLTVEVAHLAAPESGKLKIVNDDISQEFDIEQSPQTITITGLPSNGKGVDFRAYFTKNTDCSNEFEDVTIAPENCEYCGIVEVRDSDQEACNPETNTYLQTLTVVHKKAPKTGNLVVEVSGIADPIIVPIKPLDQDADGVEVEQEVQFEVNSDMAVHDVVVYFDNDTECRGEFLEAFTALENCEPCNITGIDVDVIDQTSCNPENNEYSQSITVHFEHSPKVDGQLVVVASQDGDEIKTYEVDVLNRRKDPVSIDLDGLPSDWEYVDLRVYFSEDESCVYEMEDAFRAPENCLPCVIESVTFVGEEDELICDPETNEYEASLLFSYQYPPTSQGVKQGQIKVQINDEYEKFFDIEESPQLLVLDKLKSNGKFQNVEVFFTADNRCSEYKPKLFKAPENCEPCTILDVRVDQEKQSLCNPATNTYSQELIVEYKKAPKSGYLVVNEQQFAITSSPQRVKLLNLESNGEPVNISVHFDESEEECLWYQEEVFIAPENCLPCVISSVEELDDSKEIVSNYLFNQTVRISFAQAKGDVLVVNNKEYEVDSNAPFADIKIENLVRDGFDKEVFAYFKDEPSCSIEGEVSGMEPNRECEIEQVIANTTSSCDPETGLFNQQITVFYKDQPEGSMLAIDLLDGYLEEFEVTGSPQTITLEGVKANGFTRSVMVAFTQANGGCIAKFDDVFTAPSECLPCELNVEVGETSECYEGGKFDQDILISFENHDLSGYFVVNGRSYEVESNPQMITMKGLSADGESHDLYVRFSDTEACNFEEESAYQAPEPCKELSACPILNVVLLDLDQCLENGMEYTQGVKVYHEDLAEDDKIIVNGIAYAVEASPQLIELDLVHDSSSSNEVVISVEGYNTCNIEPLNTDVQTCEEEKETCEIISVEKLGIGNIDPISSTMTMNVGITFEDCELAGNVLLEVMTNIEGKQVERFIVPKSQNKTYFEYSIPNVPYGNGIELYTIGAGFSLDFNTQMKTLDVSLSASEKKALEVASCSINSISHDPASIQCNGYIYNLTIYIEHDNAPSTGSLVVNGVEFEIKDSPQEVVLEGNMSSDALLTVEAYFSKNSDCRYSETFEVSEASRCKDITSIDEANSLELQISPVPVTDNMNIRSVSEGERFIRIFDLNGSVVFEAMMKVGESEINLDVSKLLSGIYIVEIMSKQSGFAERVKVIKK
ncbi:zinc-dependent metalloprotease [Aureibacter tunicatorum]|uniref:Fibronectin type-III domain-containing protein n=1 Tax=Aureibacter tunicatorum TaxID=866807 RepID=A0AAE3XKS7_9BACT|nr:GEVED domain-containing protein [Aureibacter tunicatorum]MDR6239661.1 hypothetical protein [Aureibacter tunicatorum]BDD04137.1 hypothetical protein AUTU_16200 [Aureibacter tunicatorum]